MEAVQAAYLLSVQEYERSRDQAEGEETAPVVDLTGRLYDGDLGLAAVRGYPHPIMLEALGLRADGEVFLMRPREVRPGVDESAHPNVPREEVEDACAMSTDELRKWAKARLPKELRGTKSNQLPAAPSNRPPFQQESDQLTTPYCMRLLRPLPHQLQGAAAILHRIFQPVEISTSDAHSPYPSAPAVTFHADTMGLGKTYQTLLVIALLAHLWQLQSDGKPLPPFFGPYAATPAMRPHRAPELTHVVFVADKPFFCGSARIPDHPFIIIVPLPLLDQWIAEAARFLQPAAFTIFKYNPTGNQRATWFTDSGGDWMKCTHKKMHRRIIIASYNVSVSPCAMGWFDRPTLCRTLQAVQREAEAVHSMANVRPPSATATSLAEANLKAAWKKAEPVKSLFHMHFTMAIVDEAHGLRTLGREGLAVAWLLQRAYAVTMLSGTPLFTSPLVSANVLLG